MRRRKNLIDLNGPASQTALADLVGVSKQAISAMAAEGKLPDDCRTLGELVRAYVERLREQAAGRLGDESLGLDLVQERAALAREQRIAQELKNQIARGEYAPIGLLADTLAVASGAVVDRFDQLEGALRKSCPDLPDEATATIQAVIAGARNAWTSATVKIVADHIETMLDDDSDEPGADPEPFADATEGESAP